MLFTALFLAMGLPVFVLGLISAIFLIKSSVGLWKEPIDDLVLKSMTLGCLVGGALLVGIALRY